MIIKQYVKDFEKMGFGMFVHFGLFSVYGHGEWALDALKLNKTEYEKMAERFNPDKDWAENLVLCAKDAGCKYITLTTRHHEGFSLFDTCGLSDYDAPHYCGRDLIREFTDACKKHNIVPFFYMTLFDWHTDLFERDFKSYMVFLRDSVELLCKNYGKIGGLWFDGYWKNPKADWEENKLYGVIRKYQPEAMIINNTGMVARGQRGNIEIDAATFERGRPIDVNTPDAPKYLAGEMCQVLNDHWGYAEGDLNYKSVGSLINDLVESRRYHANFLLNIGPMANGEVRPIDREILKLIGVWTKLNGESIYGTEPSAIEPSDEEDFILKNGETFYLFIKNVPMVTNMNVGLDKLSKDTISFSLERNIESAVWLDDGAAADYTEKDGKVSVKTRPFEYGKSQCVRIVKIQTK